MLGNWENHLSDNVFFLLRAGNMSMVVKEGPVSSIRCSLAFISSD